MQHNAITSGRSWWFWRGQIPDFAVRDRLCRVAIHILSDEAQEIDHLIAKPLLPWVHLHFCPYCDGIINHVDIVYIKKADQWGKNLMIREVREEALGWCEECDRVWICLRSRCGMIELIEWQKPPDEVLAEQDGNYFLDEEDPE